MQRSNSGHHINLPHLSSGTPTDDASESSGSDNLSGLLLRRTSRAGESPLQSFATELTHDLRLYSQNGTGTGTPPSEQKFVGTPDYLAPETILGLRGDDARIASKEGEGINPFEAIVCRLWISGALTLDGVAAFALMVAVAIGARQSECLLGMLSMI